MDGTIVDTEGLWLQTEHEVMEVLGATWTDDDQAACLGGPLERVSQYMLDRSGAGRSVDDVGLMLLDSMEGRLRASPLLWRPGARDLLVECRERGVRSALVSASWSRLIAAVSEKMHEDLGHPAFDVVVAGDDVADSKPHPAPYLMAASALNAAPVDCLALEDSPTGVRSAVAAGCAVVAIPHIADVAVEGAAVISSLEGWTLQALWSLACRERTAGEAPPA